LMRNSLPETTPEMVLESEPLLTMWESEVDDDGAGDVDAGIEEDEAAAGVAGNIQSQGVGGVAQDGIGSDSERTLKDADVAE